MSTYSDEGLNRRQLKIGRVYRLTDPLGAAGFRATRTRVSLESRWRTWLFAIALGSCIATTGALMVSNQHLANPPSSTTTSAVVVSTHSVPHTRTKSS